MKTLAEAWGWYKNTANQLELMRRLGKRYWDRLPWNDGLLNEDLFRMLEGNQVVEGADLGLAPLSDLAVVVLFSVFESQVRQRVLDDLEEEADGLEHRALKQAAQDARERIKEGSFFWVLESFKDEHADLVEHVNQVRQYRNWVAHGRRGAARTRVTPDLAYERLSRFLSVLIPTTPAEPIP